MLNLSSETNTRTLQLVEALARQVGLLPPLPEGPPLGTVTQSIGTTGRDWSTMTEWEAQLDNAAYYSASDDAVGECYNDSQFSEAVTINGGGTIGLSSVTLTAAAGERHDGAAGTGAELNATGTLLTSTGDVEWLDVIHSVNGIATQTSGPSFRNLLVHDGTVSLNSSLIKLSAGSAVNCIYYNLYTSTGNRIVLGINPLSGIVANCTVYNIEHAGPTTGYASGIYDGDGSVTEVRNCLSLDSHAVAADFGRTFKFAVFQTCGSSDTSGQVDNIVSSDCFVSTTPGSEDLHLKSGADAIDAGTDLGTTPTGVNIDIDGRDRDAMGDSWDMGADEYVAAGGAAPTGVLSGPLVGPLGGPV